MAASFSNYALITGASQGIGFFIAKHLYLAGCDLLLVARNKEKLEKAKSLLLPLRKNGSIIIFPADLSKEAAAEKIYEYSEKKGIRVDVLVNNAGIGIHGSHIEQPLKAVREMLFLDIHTLVELSTLYGKKMQNRGSGWILQIASTAAFQPVPFLAAYSAAKSYVLYFSEALAMELEDSGVIVTCFSPGHTDTEFFSKAQVPDSNNFYDKSTRASPEDVAKKAIKALEKKKLSAIYGWKNLLLANIGRFGPRKMVAKISKALVKK